MKNKTSIFTCSICLLGIGLVSAYNIPKEPPPTYSININLNEQEMVSVYNCLNASKSELPNSNLPAIQVNQSLRIFDSIMVNLAIQYKKYHPDTTKKEK